MLGDILSSVTSYWIAFQHMYIPIERLLVLSMLAISYSVNDLEQVWTFDWIVFPSMQSKINSDDLLLVFWTLG